jgi:hypothetical protein
MHRQRTYIAAHVPHRGLRDRVQALERKGVVATYSLHDRVLGNAASRRRHARDGAALDDVQRDLLGRLDADGYAVLPARDLLGADAVDAVQAQGDAFVEATERGLAGDESTGLKRRAGKEFVVRAHSFDGAVLGLDDAWLRACLSDRLLGLANAYLRMRSKLSYVDLWYTVPQAEDTERTASQLWHRDFDDRHLLKAFLYLVDVDEQTGPFEYVAGSHPGGRYSGLWGWRPLGTGRIAETEVAAGTSAADVKTFAAPRGTLILCNTSGLHRGGFSTGKPRVLATATYCSPASLRSLSSRNFTPAPDVLARLEPAARDAVT